MKEWMQKLLYFYKMEYCSGPSDNDFTNFAGKWVELENTILCKVTQDQKDIHGIHPLINISQKSEYSMVGNMQVGGTTRQSQMPGMWKAPKTQLAWH